MKPAPLAATAMAWRTMASVAASTSAVEAPSGTASRNAAPSAPGRCRPCPDLGPDPGRRRRPRQHPVQDCRRPDRPPRRRPRRRRPGPARRRPRLGPGPRRLPHPCRAEAAAEAVVRPCERHRPARPTSRRSGVEQHPLRHRQPVALQARVDDEIAGDVPLAEVAAAAPGVMEQREVRDLVGPRKTIPASLRSRRDPDCSPGACRRRRLSSVYPRSASAAERSPRRMVKPAGAGCDRGPCGPTAPGSSALNDIEASSGQQVLVRGGPHDVGGVLHSSGFCASSRR